MDNTHHNCHYCGNKLGAAVRTGSGLDRIDNNKGYEPGNIISCCKTCNMIKNDALTKEETEVAVAAILAFRTYGAK